MERWRSRRAVRIAGYALLALVLLLVLAQLFLPSIAAQRITDKLSPYGSVQSVSVSAWPAIELLWGSAESVTVNARSLALTPAQSASLLAKASGSDRVDATVAALKEGPLRLTDAVLAKRGHALSGAATTSAADVAAALPPGVGVSLLASEGGRVAVRVRGSLFGLTAGLDVLAEASGGSLVAHPVAAPVHSLHLTVFSDPRIDVTAIGARALGTQPPSYRLSMSALLR
ncbi:MAG TPA: hypothetical protein VKG82_03730 [Solirubrobacteraceae bacterium]|nr:hypothetical protein [Solirubrobacteraceae bacterium]